MVAGDLRSAYNQDMRSSNRTIRTELPVELRALIRMLRRQMRRYCLLSGLLGLVTAAAVIFWVTTGLDFGWFALQRLELPVGLRAGLLVVMLAGAVWLLFRNLVVPLWRRLQDRDLALLLERRFPEFQDRLITAVEGVEGLTCSGPLSSQMLARTISDACQMSQNTPSSAVFKTAPLKQRSWTAGILAMSVVATGAAAPETLPRWWKAFVRCDVVYHERTTDLDVYVIQQPGDRRLAFRTLSEQRVYLHPRSNDLELEFIVPETVRRNGEPWVIPERIRVDVRRTDGTTSRTYVSPASERTFRYVVTRLQEDIEIELLAGDFRIPRPLTVRTVSPPVLDNITLQCRYPGYTQWNQLRGTELQITGSEVSLPVGTEFRLQAVCSKPLQAVRISTNEFDLSGGADTSVIEIHDGGLPIRGAGLISADGFQVMTDFVLMRKDEKIPAEEQDDLLYKPDTEDAALYPENVLRIPPNTSLKFSLHDRDDIVSTRPLVFHVRGIEDRPPVIDVRVDGVDSAITRRAVIPFTGSISDDYGLMSAGFEFTVDDETHWRPRPFSDAFSKNATVFLLGRETIELPSVRKPELFQVQPLDLTEGQTLSIALTAGDGCAIDNVNISRGNPFVFRIVSNEELLSLLYAREINLRRRFEQALRDLEQVRNDLMLHKVVALRIESAGDEASSKDRIGLTTCATGSGNTLRRQRNEFKSILLSFDEIIQQLINNAVPPAQLSETMRRKIVVPLQAVVNTEVPKADRVLSRFRVAATERKPVLELVTESEKQISSLITRLKLVLESVKDMAEFHEVLSDLRAVHEEQKRIQEETRRLKRQRLIDSL
ncbi:MAG: hypothetical protein MK110_15530 [Fuerstiella sp.]|nr:hypothetical protein [Fuerstiella sp.]